MLTVEIENLKHPDQNVYFAPAQFKIFSLLAEGIFKVFKRPLGAFQYINHTSIPCNNIIILCIHLLN